MSVRCGATAGVALVALISACPASAQTPPRPPDLALVSLEDLMNIEITSVSHTEQRIGDVAAAVSVITRDDIRRSGMTKLPELLRLVPGLHVAQINSNAWAVTARGFNELFSDKLLVLIDGRSVYNALFSGVFWEAQDMLLDDIEQIEVIRGPGAATWGANAVNGVINIVTKSAAQTQGTLVRVGVGTFDRGQVAIRYGGSLGDVAYRVYSQWSAQGKSVTAPINAPAGDGWRSVQSGFRIDKTTLADAVTLEGSANISRLNPLWVAEQLPGPIPVNGIGLRDATDAQAFSVLGRWTHRRGRGAAFQLQAFAEVAPRSDTTVAERQVASGVDAQYEATSGRHRVVAGAGFRSVNTTVGAGFTLSIDPNPARTIVLTTFAQDQIALGPAVSVTVGAKIERDSHVGWGIQPSARALWTIAPGRRAWASVSRALRTPSLNQLTGRINAASVAGGAGPPILISLIGNPDFHSEQFVDAEIGYRAEYRKVSVDVTGFAGRYEGLRTDEPLAPRFEATPAPAHLLIATQYGNLLQATTAGTEAAVHVAPTAQWRLDGSYSFFHLTPAVAPESGDTHAMSVDGAVPRHQWQLRSSVSLPAALQFDTLVLHAGTIVSAAVPAYTRVDARLEWRLSPQLSAAVVGHNLFDRAHVEFGGANSPMQVTGVPRSASIVLTWGTRP